MLNDLLSAFPSIDPDAPIPDPIVSSWEDVALLAIGSPEKVQETIHELDQRGFAEVSAWSKLLPAPTRGEVMSILMQRRSRSVNE